MQIIFNILNIFEFILFTYLAGNVLYILVFAIAGTFTVRKSIPPFKKFRHITLLITAYKEDEIIESIVKSALIQDYPEEKIEIILIADSFSTETVESLARYPIKLVVANLNESTKVHSLQLALEYLPACTDFVVILDADNVMESNCLRKLNMAFDLGYKVIQCHRVAKNTNSSFALLDAVSEEVNNNIFRKGHRVLHLSAALIGSAIAFEAGTFRKFIPGLQAVGGFDKELELALLKNSVTIDYLHEAYVYDEKIANSQAFYKQRRRWISSQLYYFGKGILPGFSELFVHGNIDLFNKSMQFSLFPRVMLLGSLAAMSVLQLFIKTAIPSVLWFVTFVLCALAILVSIPNHFYNRQTFRALLSLPRAFILMVLVLFRLKKANKQFIHTEHHYQSYY